MGRKTRDTSLPAVPFRISAVLVPRAATKQELLNEYRCLLRKMHQDAFSRKQLRARIEAAPD